jgi:hypothetical protein
MSGGRMGVALRWPYLGEFLVNFTCAACGSQFLEWTKQAEELRLYSGCILPTNWGHSEEHHQRVKNC